MTTQNDEQLLVEDDAPREAVHDAVDGGDDVSTEEHRLALQRYRAFFGRLLSV